jgi:lipoprotein-anchoring transpeptidase ErfK/SrfK
MVRAPAGRGAAADWTGVRALWRTDPEAAAARVCAVLAAAVAFALAGAVSARAANPRGSVKNPYDVITRFAVANVQKPIYRQPNVRSRVVNRLSFYTTDNEALQTYRFIAARRVRGTLWEHIDVPMRPNGQTGWVKRVWLGPVKTADTLIVVKRRLERLWVYRRGVLIFTSPVGVGNWASGWATPPGHFWIDQGFTSTDPFYGPWAFGTTDFSNDTDFPDGSIVGIHGTNAPWLIPGDPSHGCVRLQDPEILKLKPLVGIGTAVWIE